MRRSKHNWREYSEHTLAVMPPLVTKHILSRSAPEFTCARLTIPVMVAVNGVETQGRFPADYPVETLRGELMVRYHADYDILAEGETYPGHPETRAVIKSIFREAASRPMKDRENYDVLAKTWAGYVLDDMEADVRRTAREMPEYDSIVRHRDIIETWDLAMQASVGPVVNDVAAILSLMPAEGVENARLFLEDYIAAYRRIQDRKLDSDELLELMFSSRLFLAAHGHSVLGAYALISNREQSRPNTEQLMQDWLRMLAMDAAAEERSSRVVSTRTSQGKRGIESPRVASTHTSLLCGEYCTRANVTTLKRPGKRAPPPIATRDSMELCFNCMGQHLVKDCEAPRSVCPVGSCGEYHHAEAHKFIANRRLRRKMHMGPDGRRPVKNHAGDKIYACLSQIELDRYSDQCIRWHHDVVNQERACTAAMGTTGNNDTKATNTEDAGVDVIPLGRREDPSLNVTVGDTIDSAETGETPAPIDACHLVALATGDEVHSPSTILWSPDSSDTTEPDHIHGIVYDACLG